MCLYGKTPVLVTFSIEPLSPCQMHPIIDGDFSFLVLSCNLLDDLISASGIKRKAANYLLEGASQRLASQDTTKA